MLRYTKAYCTSLDIAQFKHIFLFERLEGNNISCSVLLTSNCIKLVIGVSVVRIWIGLSFFAFSLLAFWKPFCCADKQTSPKFSKWTSTCGRFQTILNKWLSRCGNDRFRWRRNGILYTVCCIVYFLHNYWQSLLALVGLHSNPYLVVTHIQAVVIPMV